MDLPPGKSTDLDTKELEIEIDFGEMVTISLREYEEASVLIKKHRLKADPNVKEIRHLAHGDLVETSTLVIMYKDRETARKECRRLASDLEEKRINVAIAEDVLDRINRLEELKDEESREHGMIVNHESRPYTLLLDSEHLNLSPEEDTEEGKTDIAQTLTRAFEVYGKVVRFEMRAHLLFFSFSRYASAYAAFLAYFKRDWRDGSICLEIENPDVVIETLSTILH